MGIKPENSGGEATGSRECPRKLITANSLVRGSVTDMTERVTFDRQAEERFATEQQVSQEGRVSPASTSQQQQAGLALAATERSGHTATRRLAQLVSAEQQRVAPAGRGTRVSGASTQLPERQLPLKTGSKAKAKPRASYGHTHCTLLPSKAKQKRKAK